MSTEEPTQAQPEQSSVPEETPGDEAGTTYPPGLGPEPTLTPKDVRADATKGDDKGEGEEGDESGGAGAEQQSSGNHQTVDEVLADVDSGKVTAQDALDKERAGQNRSTLVAGLQQRGAS